MSLPRQLPVIISGPAVHTALWALATLLALCLAAVTLILLPGLPSLLLALGAIVTPLGITLLRLLRHIVTARPSRSASIVLALMFLVGFGVLLGWVRSEVLFGYKAVDDRLAPLLLRGDHYFADRLFYRYDEILNGEVIIFRDTRGKVATGRVAYLPGEVMEQGSKRITLTDDEYGMQRDNMSNDIEIVPRARFEARALVIYGSYNPEVARLDWVRSGRRVHE